ncbi:MAG: fibronectin type III domain-containing protein [Caulobacteraceae bacterium]|nr:fibronectin type III domain-containing protein [Caulobacteraceae bacterium]
MRPRGGIIGANITPTQTAASGIWTLREVEAYQRAGAWAALPGAPTSVSGTPGSAQVSLTWSAPAATGGYSITDYAVQYSSNSGSSWTTFSRSASSSTSATVTGLTNGTGYVFRVAAVTVVGTGSYSSASSSVTPIASFTPMAVLLTSGTSYTVPSGATSMKAWAVGGGGPGSAWMNSAAGAGGCAYKTWSVSASTVSYVVGAAGINSTVTYSGTTITGNGAASIAGGAGGSFSGGDGGAQGGSGESFGGGVLRTKNRNRR